MTPSQRKNLATAATSIVETLVLDVLHANAGTCVGAADIGRQAQLYDPGAGGAGGNLANANQWFITKVLSNLMARGFVDRCDLPGTPGGQGHQGWEITPAGLAQVEKEQAQ